MPASVWIINLVVLGVVLEADLGTRRITWFRLARPLVVAGAIIAYYLVKTPVATRGGGLGFELALAALGIVLGVAAGLIFRVFRGADGFRRSQAGIGYAALWIVVVGARIGFSYATSHSRHLLVWLFTHHVTANAITDALIFMAAGMLLLRTAVLHLRAPGCPVPTPAPVGPASRPPPPHPPTAEPAHRHRGGAAMFAHDIVGGLGIPAGIAIAATIILRRKGMALRARRQQAPRPAGQHRGHHQTAHNRGVCRRGTNGPCG